MQRSEPAAASTLLPLPAHSARSPTPPEPSRRRLLKLGAGAAVVVAVAGATGAWLWSPGWHGNKLTADGRAVFRATALAVLEGLWPSDAAALEAALDAHLLRIEATLAALPRHTQDELAQMLGLLQLAPARRWLTRLEVPWQKADLPAAHAAIRHLHSADDPLRQQIFHALRDLTAASYVAAPANWPQMGYPGPTEI